jgi:predicted HAD superfamily Cof-like phosphohydrolase
MSKPGKSARAALAVNIIAGFNKHYSKGSQKLTLSGGAQTTTVAEVKSQLQQLVTNRANAVAAKATAKAKVDAENEQMATLIALLNAIVELILFTFGSSPEVLADFGLAPRKVPAPQTAVAKAVAVAKREATRKARGTTGPKAKKSVKGAINASLLVTPVAAPAPAAPVISAAPATPPAGNAPDGGTTPQH